MDESKLRRIGVFQNENDILYSKILKDLIKEFSFIDLNKGEFSLNKGEFSFIDLNKKNLFSLKIEKESEKFFEFFVTDEAPLYFLLGEYSLLLQKDLFVRYYSLKDEDEDEKYFSSFDIIKGIINLILSRFSGVIDLSEIYYSYCGKENSHFFEDTFFYERMTLSFVESGGGVPSYLKTCNCLCGAKISQYKNERGCDCNEYNSNMLLNSILTLLLEIGDVIRIEFDFLNRANFYTLTEVSKMHFLGRISNTSFYSKFELSPAIESRMHSDCHLFINTIKTLQSFEEKLFEKGIELFDFALYGSVLLNLSLSSIESEESDIIVKEQILPFLCEYSKIMQKNSSSLASVTSSLSSESLLQKNRDKNTVFFFLVLKIYECYNEFPKRYYDDLFSIFDFCHWSVIDDLTFYRERFLDFNFDIFYTTLISYKFRNIYLTKKIVKKHFNHLLHCSKKNPLRENSLFSSNSKESSLFEWKVFTLNENELEKHLFRSELSLVKKGYHSIEKFVGDFNFGMKLYLKERSSEFIHLYDFISLPLLILREVVYLDTLNKYKKFLLKRYYDSEEE